jgi:hypothetical protein
MLRAEILIRFKPLTKKQTLRNKAFSMFQNDLWWSTQQGALAIHSSSTSTRTIILPSLQHQLGCTLVRLVPAVFSQELFKSLRLSRSVYLNAGKVLFTAGEFA